MTYIFYPCELGVTILSFISFDNSPLCSANCIHLMQYQITYIIYVLDLFVHSVVRSPTFLYFLTNIIPKVKLITPHYR